MKHKYVIFLIRLSLILAIFGSIYERIWMALFVSILTLFLTFIPNIIKNKYNIELPTFLQVFIIAFIYASLFLGEVHNFYHKFWWWDSLLHFLSGIALGFAGFLILYILYKTKKLKASPFLITVLVFSFAMAMGAIWEIFEFLMDEFFGFDMQKARNLCVEGYYCDSRVGVIDTMIDLILDALGALLACTIGYLFLKGKKIFFFGEIVKEFETKNKQLFKKSK